MFQKEQAVSRLIEILVEYIPNLKAQIERFLKRLFCTKSSSKRSYEYAF